MWYRLSAQGYSQAVSKSFAMIAEALVRKRLFKLLGAEPGDAEVAAGVKRVIKDIEREHGPLHRAAVDSPDDSLRPVVEMAVHRLKW